MSIKIWIRRRGPTAASILALVLASGLSSGATTDLSVGSASVVEGNSGTSKLRFTISRTGDLTLPLSIGVETDGTPAPAATAGVDYVSLPAGNRIVFPAGQSSMGVDVSVLGDTALEPDETLLLRLSNARQVSQPELAGAYQYFVKPSVSAGGSAYPSAITSADVDGDGKPDVLVAHENGFSVYPNRTTDGRLKLGAQQVFDTSLAPSAILSRDFDADGRPDLILAQRFNTKVLVLRNLSSNGVVQFAPPVEIALGGPPDALYSADINGDAKPDIVTTNGWAGTISVLLNLSTASELRFSNREFATSMPVGSAVLADFNTDGKTDIALVNGDDNHVVLLRNRSTLDSASFTSSNIAVSSRPDQLAAGDLDGDGKPELIVTDGPSNSHKLLINRSEGGEMQFTTNDLGYLPQTNSLHALDVDGDGKLDLVQVNRGVKLNTSTGPGDFRFAETVVTPTDGSGSHYADLDGDQRPEICLVRSYGWFAVTRNLSSPGKARFATRVTFGSLADGSALFGIASGDIDGDGRTDLVTVGSSKNDFALFANRSFNQELRLEYGGAVPLGKNLVVFRLEDLNLDGKPDLVMSDHSGEVLTAYRNTSTSAAFSFASPVSFPANTQPYNFALADFDGDGRKDAALANVGQDKVSVLRNLSTASLISFGAAQTVPSGPVAGAIAAGDLDGDGKADLAVATTSGSLSVLRNVSSAGTIAFAPMKSISVIAAFSFAIVDVDGDGKPELIVDGGFGVGASILPNASVTGDIRFGTAIPLSTESFGGYPIRGMDLDGDGRPEIIARGPLGVSVFQNLSAPGNIQLAPQMEYALLGPDGLEIADLNGDGQLDLAFAQNAEHSGSVLLGLFTEASISTNEGIGRILDDDLDTAPDSFGFPWRFGAARGSVQVSDAATIAGINTLAPISVTGGEYSINGGSFVATAGTVKAGDQVRARHTAASGFGATVQTVVTIGGVSASFASTTVAADTLPDSLSFPAKPGVEPGAVTESAASQVKGIDTSVPVSVTGGEYSINGGAFTAAPGTAAAGDQLRLRHRAASGYGQTTQTTISVGDTSASFSSTTRPADTTPDAVSFASAPGVAPDTLVQSAAIQVSGIEVAVAISIVGGEYSINGGNFGSIASTVAPGDIVVVRLRSASGLPGNATAVLRLNNLEVPFSVESLLPIDLGEKGGGALPPLMALIFAGLALLRRRTRT